MTQREQRSATALAVLVFALTGCGAGEETVFDEIASPGGDYVLRVSVAESRVPQGPFFVRAYLIPRGETTGPRVVDTELVNDGVPFTAGNIAVRWVSARQALMCLRASDLPDRGLRIELSEPPRVEEVDRC